MDLAIGFAAGFFALPWLWMMLVISIFVVDVVLCETDNFGWGTSLMLVSMILVTWLGGDTNPFKWAWSHIPEILEFLLVYFLIGAVWSVGKWYLYLLNVKRKVQNGSWGRWCHAESKLSEEQRKKTRPEASWASNNAERIIGWIGHWPFSMIGSVFGDFLVRIVRNIYNVLSSLYEHIADHVFEGFNSDRED